MAYRSRSRSRSRGYNRDKYSIERTSVSAPVGTLINGIHQANIAVVPASTAQGMRKVKHVTVTITSPNSEGTIWWALVYVPQGYQPNALGLT